MANVAFLLGQDFEDSEFRVPYDELKKRGHSLTVIGTDAGKTVEGKHGRESITIERSARDAQADAFDALVIPGGYGPDHLRLDGDAVSLVEEMMTTGKPVAAICHAAQLLVEADVVKGRTLTSWPSVRTDVENAGGKWIDKQLVEDGNLITSRKPDDLDAFCGALVQRLAR